MAFKYEVIGNDLYITDTYSGDIQCTAINNKFKW